MRDLSIFKAIVKSILRFSSVSLYGRISYLSHSVSCSVCVRRNASCSAACNAHFSFNSVFCCLCTPIVQTSKGPYPIYRLNIDTPRLEHIYCVFKGYISVRESLSNSSLIRPEFGSIPPSLTSICHQHVSNLFRHLKRYVFEPHGFVQ